MSINASKCNDANGSLRLAQKLHGNKRKIHGTARAIAYAIRPARRAISPAAQYALERRYP